MDLEIIMLSQINQTQVKYFSFSGMRNPKYKYFKVQNKIEMIGNMKLDSNEIGKGFRKGGIRLEKEE